jgi:hypothetical protein
MIKKLKIFLESKNHTFTKISNDEAKEWLKNVKPIKFSEDELEKIKELIDFRVSDGFLDYPFSSIVLETGVIYSLNRDFYLICLGSLNKTSNYWCKGLPNLISFIKQKLVTK